MPDLKKLVRIIKDREALVESVPESFIRALERSQNALLTEIIDFVKGVETAAGRIENIPANIQMAIKMRDDMRRWLRQAGYYEAITSFGKNYQEAIDLSRKYYAALDLPEVFSRRDLETLSKFKADDLSFMLNNDQRVINLTYNELVSSIHQQRTFRDLARRMENLHLDTTEGDKVLSGLLKKYNGTYAATAFASFDRRVQNIKAAELGMERFLYSGGLIRDSREFCMARAGKIYDKKTILSWEGQTWKGKIPGCDIFVCLGGYNCQHILSPVNFTAKEMNELEAVWAAAK